jgi:hypothetical protein
MNQSICLINNEGIKELKNEEIHINEGVKEKRY